VKTSVSAPSAPRWLSDDEMRTWLSLLRVVMVLPGSLDRQLRDDAGIAHASYQILAMLSAAPDRAMRMSELASLTATSPSRLSHAVSSLETRGWVERRQCAADKRGQFAHLTDAGMQVLVETAPGHVEQVRRLVFDRLDPDEVHQLGSLLARLGDGLDLPPAEPS
jgi:DNA-binding MarR family transcriptional regulator